MKHFLSILSIILILISCDNTTEDKKSKGNKENIETTTKSNSLPILPVEIIEDIAFNADYLDVLFEDLDFSLSQSDNKSIRIFLQNIDFKTPIKDFNNNCKPFASALFSKQGNTIIEADVYHSDKCYYFLFLDKDRKPKYGNLMSNPGIAFFNNLKQIV